jgi:Protein of unknown function (DUF1566)
VINPQTHNPNPKMKLTLKTILLSASIVLATAAQAALIPNAAGDEVTDTATGLIWKRCSEGQAWDIVQATCTGTAMTFTHEQALQLAATQAGTAGWRLPNVKELSSIVDASRASPAIDTASFPATPSKWYWTSSPYAGLSGYAWGVSFYYGSVNGDGRGSADQVRLVR